MLGQLARYLAPPLIVIALVWASSRPKTRLFPGLGHFYLGHTRRGVYLATLIVATFVAGMILADWRNVSPFDRHPIWGIAHSFGGLMSLAATIATRHLMIVRENPYYATGCLYSGVAALLNVLAMIDAWDLAAKEPAPKSAGVEATS